MRLKPGNAAGAIALVICLLAAGTAAGQTTQRGQIRGRVTDSRGLPVPGVDITVSSPALPGARASVTAGDGTYRFPDLPPGLYEMTFRAEGLEPVDRSATVLAGASIEQSVTLIADHQSGAASLTATGPSTIGVTIGATYGKEEIDVLATPRTLHGIAQLAPGVTGNTPNPRQIAVNGGFAFDNLFLINGVDVSDNLFGIPFNLFIEDAIEQTQIMTSGIGAEYGRFTGGVVNAVTRSGGNTLAGSWRTNVSNPSWSAATPLERCADPGRIVAVTCRPAAPRSGQIELSHEATLGGPIAADRAWFFGATQLSEVSTSSSLPQTNLQNTQTDTNRRGEVKITGTLSSNHTIQSVYVNNSTRQRSRPTLSYSIDRFAAADRTLPNWYLYGNYRGVIRKDLFVETRLSRRRFQFKDSGGTSTAIVDSPFLTRTGERGHYNAPYFDAADPESRNHSLMNATISYSVNTARAGWNHMKLGYEFVRAQRIGGNSQSATGYVFDADYVTDAAGNPTFDAQGHLQPIFAPSTTLIENWIPSRGAVLNVDYQTVFGQDHVVFSNHWSADIGFRYERAHSETTGGIVGADSATILPRLAASYDVHGDGKRIVQVTYGRYAGRYNDAQVGANSNIANPDLLLGVYVGPPGTGRAFAPGFDPANYLMVYGQFPASNVRIDGRLSPPIAEEVTATFRTSMLNRVDFEGTVVRRNLINLIEDERSIANGTTTVTRDDVHVGTFTNVVYRNSDEARRDYTGLQFQGRYRIAPRWSVNGHYTLQLNNDGNYEGEEADAPGSTSHLADFPEVFTAARHYPDGRLDDFQRHKMRLWSIYNAGFGRFGDMTVSGLWRIDSGTTFSYVAVGQPLTGIQHARLAAAGYPDPPLTQNVYFGTRGEGRFKGFHVLDVAATYNVPAFRGVRAYLNSSVYNVLNNQKLIRWNVVVNQSVAAELDANGLATSYTPSATFGLANNNNQFPVPSIGGTGGRTWRLALGVRF